MNNTCGISVVELGALPNDGRDCAAAFAAAVDRLSEAGGTLFVPDGVFEIGRPLVLPPQVSLTMAARATIRAAVGFEGEAVVVKAGTPADAHKPFGDIRGGMIDGGRHRVTGLKIVCACRQQVSDLTVWNARHKGIHVTRGGYEVNLRDVRCDLAQDAGGGPDSIGIHYEGGDSLVSGAVVIGYETAVRSDAFSNDFQLVHVWNWSDGSQGPLRWCFYCNGWGDSYSQCYADSPWESGFHVTQPFNRIIACRVLYSPSAEDNAGAGVHVAPGATNGAYLGNVFEAREGHRLGRAFDGDLTGATILGNGSESLVAGGHVNQIPSGGGAAGPIAPLAISGGPLRLARPLSGPPAPGDGAVGDLAWAEEGDDAWMWLKTSRGWKKARLE